MQKGFVVLLRLLRLSLSPACRPEDCLHGGKEGEGKGPAGELNWEDLLFAPGQVPASLRAYDPAQALSEGTNLKVLAPAVAGQSEQVRAGAWQVLGPGANSCCTTGRGKSRD